MVYPDRSAAGLFVLLLAAGVASAQIYPGGGYPGGYPGGGYPGGYPGGGYPGGGYPGGGYPGGGYPGGYPNSYPGGYPGAGGTIPIPAPTRGNQGSTNSTQKGAALPNFRGKIRQIDSKSITISLDDDRVMDFKRTDKTKFFKNGDEVKSPSDFRPGDQVSVEGPEDMAGNLTAINVYWEKPGSAVTRTSDKDSTPDTWAGDGGKPTTTSNANAGTASTAVTPAPAKPDATDDPGRPILRRGGPSDPSREDAAPVPTQPAAQAVQPTAQAAPGDSDRPVLRRAQANPDQAPATVADASVHPPAPSSQPTLSREDRDLGFGSEQKDPLIRKASNAALDFTETLPNYICQEVVTRYQSESSPANWEAQDIVTTDVVYENGKEDYRNITVGGRPFKGSMDDTGGAWSTGEFGTILINLFNPGTAAQFHFLEDSRAGDVEAKKYTFEVARENSHWSVKFGAQEYVPGYTGSAWIDPATGRVLRIEMAAHNFPDGFPTNHVETATDYEYVRLGGTQQYLLPVHSETLSCQTGTALCSRNTIDFRNYKKFEGESTITFGDAKQ